MKLLSNRERRELKANRPQQSLMWGDPRKKCHYSPRPQPAREQHKRHRQNGRVKAQVSHRGRGGRKFDQNPSHRH